MRHILSRLEGVSGHSSFSDIYQRAINSNGAPEVSLHKETYAQASFFSVHIASQHDAELRRYSRAQKGCSLCADLSRFPGDLTQLGGEVLRGRFHIELDGTLVSRSVVCALYGYQGT